MSDQPVNQPTRLSEHLTAIKTHLQKTVSNTSFNDWYHEQQFEENILHGKPYFNGLSPPKPPEQHSSNTVLQCHRKTYYRRRNAPKEGAPPEGLFWFGTEFEGRVIVPFLQDTVTTGRRVWILS